MSTTDRASQNREYVRRLLKKKQPEFAAVLDRVVWELTYACDAPSAESPAFEHDRGGRLQSLNVRGPASARPDPASEEDPRVSKPDISGFKIYAVPAVPP